jgi:predicted amidohydrolase YtcJ
LVARVLTNARIWTGHAADDGTDFEALAIHDGRIAAVGTNAEVLAAAGQEVEVIDADGRRVIPGLVDSHLHAIRAGLSYDVELDWTRVTSLVEALETIRRAALTRPPSAWIPVLGGWHPSQFAEGRGPTRAELDEMAPDHPVFVHPIYGREDRAVVNRVAIGRLGWDRLTSDPPGGIVHRDDAGQLTGELTGFGLYAKINAIALACPPEAERVSTVNFFRRLASSGLTGVLDPAGLGMSPEKYHAVRSVWAAGELPIRLRTLHGAVTPGQEIAEVERWRQYLYPGAGDQMLSVLGLGEAVHYGCHDWEGLEPFHIESDDFDGLVQIARSAAMSGWPLSVHAILDHSIGRALDAFEVVDAEFPLRDLRFSLCHVECISPPNIDRLARLGMGVTLQGRMAQKARTAAAVWGDDVLRHAPPFGDLIAAGVPFGAGTDGTRSASYDPWRTVQWMVTGEVSDGGPRRDLAHRLPIADALRAYTVGSTWFSFEEHTRGMLRPGFVADMAVLDRDVLACAPSELLGTRSLLTLVDGRVVIADGFDSLRYEPYHRPSAPLTLASS